MQALRRKFVLLSAGVFVCAILAHGQDEPSLGDAARQSRLQKQQKAQDKDTPAKDGSAKDPHPSKPPKKVITNEELPEHIGPTRTAASGQQIAGADYQQPGDDDRKAPPEQWKSRIQAQKTSIASLQSELNNLSASIQYAGSNCVSGCVQWNERQKQKQDQLEGMKAQLEQQQKNLEEMQEAARKQGYGSSVYDP
jgi:hypothetical protein